MITIFTSKTQSFGKNGEDEAVQFLVKEGYKIQERNVACPFGEIDIVAIKDSIITFFEVKSGRKGSAISPYENLTKGKLKKFLRSVEYYCMGKNISRYQIKGIIVLFEGEASTIQTIDLY